MSLEVGHRRQVAVQNVLMVKVYHVRVQIAMQQMPMVLRMEVALLPGHLQLSAQELYN
jgi:hypothetical protein